MTRNRKNLVRPFLALLAVVLLGGCATNFEPASLPDGHPANAQTQEAPRSATKRLIMTDELTRKTKAQLARKDIPNPDFQNSEMSHDMSTMDHSKMQMAPSAPTASPSDTKAVETEMKKTSDEMKKLSDELKAKSDAAKSPEKPSPPSTPSPKPSTAYWTCVMHPGIHSDKPGQCPKCGMTLVKKEGDAK